MLLAVACCRLPSPHSAAKTSCNHLLATATGALMIDADLSGANMQEVVLSKAYAVGANLKGEGGKEWQWGGVGRMQEVVVSKAYASGPT